MARANLTLHPDVSETFQTAPDRNIRCIKIAIRGESLVLDSIFHREDTAEHDFNNLLVESLIENEASLVIFCLTESTVSVQQWLLLAWVPDGCKVRDKMLYASSREDLKKDLGLGYFVAEYAASSKSDVTWAEFQSSLDKTSGKIYSETEKLVHEEMALTSIESNSIKSAAMGVLRFGVSEDAQQSFARFKSGDVNWLELNITNETIQMASSRSVQNEDSLQELVNAVEPRFIMVKLPKYSGEMISFFIYSCPENAPVKIKMTMSTCKASVMATAGDNDISFDRNLEIRGPDEIDYLLQQDLRAPAVNSPGDSTSTSSSAAAQLSHSKPQRPGKGRARVAKFKLDDDNTEN